ncbi:aldehyde dehydrogenase family protein [Mycolicibacterium pulveris]|uniref:aldehyde dehydrogenase family protein n=1 Tax=Mycolicibacterium pulveris TaxID=36813 RepID=UPI003CE81EC5
MTARTSIFAIFTAIAGHTGRWCEPATAQRISVISPHTEEPIGETPHAAPEDVDRAVRCARAAFDDHRGRG